MKKKITVSIITLFPEFVDQYAGFGIISRAIKNKILKIGAVNLRRFAELAKEISNERQIFVMTHRRVTMERADVLYGVTLAEPGLSQVIGVRVEDWA